MLTASYLYICFSHWFVYLVWCFSFGRENFRNCKTDPVFLLHTLKQTPTFKICFKEQKNIDYRLWELNEGDKCHASNF